ncbi:hypothetical protein G3A_06880 [Bacillus sp. 17376]|uniref:DUF4367 domain-containing protein n=1 Tax=Mesobacillus boroniphilus JCM 21738 TaxID=1294265 RepID=W4RKZ0_9BACI|nr:hypothetical protein [Mesobacillus boroniphilus]ESU33311.1 hypothetical protein G3A_06880 [Bacillus sp. 17376]GAE44817.1 hypothetical protein JCM21738_1563 [Mesobacillus boroniphilus JCM 21738]
MKKLSFIPIILALLLFGCQQKQNGALDTSKLEKVEPTGNATEEQLKSIPILYNVPSLKVGLEALPFEVMPPKDLPFAAMPLKMTIEDFEHDGKELRVNFESFSKNKEDKIIFLITVHNFKVDYPEGPGEEVELADGTAGDYMKGTLVFEKDGIYYSVGYYNPKVSDKQLKEDIIDLAGQML